METTPLPVLDLAALERGGDALRALDDVCAEWGAFHLVGHGVSPATQAEALAQMRAFFALPVAAKRAIERTETNPWGWFDRELTKNRRDWKEIFDFGPPIARGPLAGSQPQFPAELPDFRAFLEGWFATCHALSLRALDVCARALGAPPAALRSAFAPEHTSFLRLNFYPPCPAPAPHDLALDGDGELGIRHHTDSGALTILLHDAHPGLQVWQGGSFRLVRPLPGAFVVNLGDILQVWSNDRWRAPLHRVIAHADRQRISAPYFLNPSVDAVYAPLPSQCGAARPARYRAIAWAEFRARRAAGDYADVGEEVQISDWRS